LQFELETAATNVEMMIVPHQLAEKTMKVEPKGRTGAPSESGLS
jgi:hypothetical protein